jgi:GGDEF domain-containing protein
MRTHARKKFDEALPEEKTPSPEALHFSSLAELESRYETMRRKLGERAADDPRCEMLRLEVELAKAEYDNAGALKFEGFARRNREFFANGPRPEEVAGRRYLFVSMGELDRLNKEGHSAAGDKGLESVVRAITETAEERGEVFSVYRFDRNDYMVEFADISEENLHDFEEALLARKLDLGSFSNLEAPPLSVARMSLAEVIDIVNTGALAAEGEEEAKGPEEMAAECLAKLRRFADYELEQEKFKMRVMRAIGKIESAKSGAIARGEAENFFDTYLKKGFGDSAISSLADIEDLWQEGKDRPDFERALGLMAAEATKKRFAAEREFEEYEKHLASGLARDYLRAVRDDAPSEPARERLFGAGAKLAKIPSPRHGTEGLRILAEKRSWIGRRGDEWLKADELAYAVEKNRRDPNTGLLGRDGFYGELEEKIAQGEEVSVIFIDLGFLKYFNDAGRRAVGDAALLKSVEVIEEALAASDVKGRLYRYGGDEFTISVEGTPADAEKLKREIESVRRGAGLIPDLRSLREAGRAEDTVGDSRPDYRPMSLVFNYGIAGTESTKNLVADLSGNGELEKELESGRRTFDGFKADLLVKMADVAVGFQKAVSRFHELIGLMDHPEYKDEGSLEHKQTEAVIAASRKAIYAGLGGEMALRFWSEGRAAENKEAFEEQVERFVADRMEKASAILESEKELVDKLIETHASRNRLILELEKLGAEVMRRGDMLDMEREKIKELQWRLKEAESARLALVNAREDIARAAIDKTAKK